MAAGKKQHAELEAEMAVEVEVETESREDVWGLRLLASIESMHQLRCNGLTREVFCLGFLQVCSCALTCIWCECATAVPWCLSFYLVFQAYINSSSILHHNCF